MRIPVLAALPLLCPALTAQGTPEAPEPNNGPATAAVLQPGAQAYGNITPGDEDWFKITLGAAADLRVWTGPGFSNQIGDTRVRLLDSTGTTTLEDVDDGSFDTHGFYSVFSRSNVAAGTYYIAVLGYDPTTTGSYTLDVIAAPPGTYPPPTPPLVPVTERPEPDDPRVAGTATASAVFTRNTGVLGAAGGGNTSFTQATADYDFWAFTVGGPGAVTLSTLATALLSPVPDRCDDTVVFLANASFTVLAVNDDFGADLYSQLTYNLPAAGTYYAVVKAFGADIGTYNLDIIVTPPVPTGAASVTMRVGGCPGTAGVPALGNRLSTTGPGVAPEQPVLGSTFYLDGTNLPAHAPLLRLLGFVPLAVPFALAPYGAPGCAVEVNTSTSFALADAAGVHFWGLATPVVPAFIGVTLEQQLAVIDPAANALGLTTSNRVSSIAGISH